MTISNLGLWLQSKGFQVHIHSNNKISFYHTSERAEGGYMVYAVDINTKGAPNPYLDREFVSCTLSGPKFDARTGVIIEPVVIGSWTTASGALTGILPKIATARKNYAENAKKFFSKR